jgi:signal transduction histidine kinase
VGTERQDAPREDARPRQHAPGYLRTRFWLVAAFGAVAAGFVGMSLVVALALKPNAERAKDIALGYGESIDVLVELRGAVRAVRDVAGRAVLEPRRLEPRLLVQLRADLQRSAGDLDRLAARYDALALLPEEHAAWQPLRTRDLPLLLALAGTVLSAGEHDEADRRFVSFREVATRVDLAVEQLVRMKGAEARSAAARIDRSLRALTATALVLGASGGLAAVLLLLLALSAAGRYATALEERAAEMEAFAGRVAHDLRSPLQPIRLALGAVARDVEDPRLRSSCDRAERSVARLGRFIDDLLEFSRAGGHPPPGTTTAVGDVIGDLRDELEPRASGSDVALDMQSEPGLEVSMAPGALRAVVANLVENALKYLGSAAERRIEVRARGEGVQALVSVRDTGPGIPEDALPHLFDLHYRAAREGGGFGIGLATVKRLVEAHAGRISVESQPGRGTTFVVALPRARAT